MNPINTLDYLIPVRNLPDVDRDVFGGRAYAARLYLRLEARITVARIRSHRRYGVAGGTYDAREGLHALIGAIRLLEGTMSSRQRRMRERDRAQQPVPTAGDELDLRAQYGDR